MKRKGLWLNHLVWLWLLLSSGLTLAHSYLMVSNPKAGQMVRVMPKTVQLTFSEPLEINFSSFKVYALPNSSDPQRAAEVLFQKVMPLKNDTEARADLGLVNLASPAAKLELSLRDKLSVGWYVVMWRVLSVDSHVTSDFFVFRYQP